MHVSRLWSLVTAIALAAALSSALGARTDGAPGPRLAVAEERIDADVNARIREEGLERSRIMNTLHVLTDRYGPRLTGSPALEQAGRWAIRQMEDWGLVNGRMEPWTWGHAGWTGEVATGSIVAPVTSMLSFEVLAWTPGTGGPVTARAVHLIPPDRPGEAELNAYLAGITRDVEGAIVLVGAARDVPVEFEPAAKRRSDEEATSQYDPADAPRPAALRSTASLLSRPPATAAQTVSPAEVSRRIDRLLVEHGARVRINDAGRPHGQIVAFGNGTYDITAVVPTVVMRNEDFGRIARLLAAGTAVELQFEIVNRIHPEGATAYNAIAELPGTDLRDEIVMIGAHLDSWHSATGATDNAIGCAVMMEAARILTSIGVKPRRTIRVALWSGEEQGLLGSRAHVARHFGSFENPGPAFDKLAAYLNIDHGTGRIRGASVFGPPAAARTLRELLRPFADLGVAGALATSARGAGGTDHASFSRAGLPGINFGQDPIEYRSHTHHTNLDTYERVIEADAKQAAIVIASTAYHLAMRDEPLPRFHRADMPAPRGR